MYPGTTYYPVWFAMTRMHACIYLCRYFISTHMSTHNLQLVPSTLPHRNILHVFKKFPATARTIATDKTLPRIQNLVVKHGFQKIGAQTIGTFLIGSMGYSGVPFLHHHFFIPVCRRRRPPPSLLFVHYFLDFVRVMF
jgi:hypothetical protein